MANRACHTSPLCTGKYLKNLRKRFQDALARASSTAEESIANVRTVRSFSNDYKMVESYATDINESYRIGRNLAAITGMVMVVNIVNGWTMPLVSLSLSLSLCRFLCWGGGINCSGEESIACLVPCTLAMIDWCTKHGLTNDYISIC